MKKLKLSALLGVALSGCLAINACSDNSDGDLMAHGMWKDPDTGLTWMRCTIGQSWNGKTCEGEAILLTKADSQEYLDKFINAKNFGGFNDWRIPTIEELMSIRKCELGYERRAKRESYEELTERGRVTHDKLVELEPFTVKIVNSEGQKVEVPQSCKVPKGEKSVAQLDRKIFPNTPIVDTEYGYEVVPNGRADFWSNTETRGPFGPEVATMGFYRGNINPASSASPRIFRYLRPVR